MRTLATNISDDAYADLYHVTARLGLEPEDFARRVLLRAIRRQKTRILEAQHREGYKRNPVQAGEFALNADDTVLPDSDETW